MMSAQSTASPEERLRNLEDERAALDLVYRLHRALDARDIATCLRCFTPDATHEVRTSGERTRQAGHAGLRKMLEEAFIAHERTKHLIVGPVTTVTGDTATVESDLVRLSHAPGTVLIKHFSLATHMLVRSAEVGWLVRARVIERQT